MMHPRAKRRVALCLSVTFRVLVGGNGLNEGLQQMGLGFRGV